MPNQTVNKVQFGNQTVMDITDTTADAADVIQGEVFYAKSGARSTGTLGDATQSAHGLMSSSDKVKLDGIDAEMYKTITTPASVITITDGADDVPMALKVGIEPVQAGSGDPSPENVRPISGWTGAKVTRTGKNLLDTASYGIASAPSGLTLTPHYVDGRVQSVTIDGTYTGSSTLLIQFSRRLSSNATVLPSGKQYIFSVGAELPPRTSIQVGGTSAETGNFVLFGTSNTDDLQFTNLLGGRLTVQFLIRTGAAVFDGFTVTPMIRIASASDSSYESYQCTTYDIAFPFEAGTVYGGTLTVNKDGSGSLVVDRAKNTYSGDWSYASSTGVLYVDNTATDGKIAETLSNTYPYGGVIKGTNEAMYAPKSICVQAINGVRFAIYDTDYTSADQFNTHLSSNPLEIVYQLATPVTYSLTPGQVKTLLGVNNIWTDTGDINSLTYASFTNNVISTEERYKLSTVEAGAQVNPGNATQSAAGLMSAADKTKLDSITGNVYTDYTITIAVADWTASNGEYVYTWTNSAITTQCLADVIFVTDPDTVLAGLSLSADKVTGGMQFVCSGTPSGALTVKIRIIDSDTTAALQNATTTQDGIMSAQDKVKLDAVYQASAYHESDMGIVETTNTATHAISAGQYVIWKGQLYTADSAITVGATLAASGGSKNLTAVANGGLNALNDKITMQPYTNPIGETNVNVLSYTKVYKTDSVAYVYLVIVLNSTFSAGATLLTGLPLPKDGAFINFIGTTDGATSFYGLLVDTSGKVITRGAINPVAVYASVVYPI